MAVVYGISAEQLLRHGLGATVEITPRSLISLDMDPPKGVLTALSKRTGVGLADLRLMTIAGWVPWLLDELQPGEDSSAFATYVRQDSVLLPFGRVPFRTVPRWRAWLPSQLMARACPRCLSDHRQGLRLMARIPLLLSCPGHGCLLEPVLGHPAQYLFWADPVAEPRPAGDDIVAMDRYTQEGLSVDSRSRVHGDQGGCGGVHVGSVVWSA
jgi:hypothetical protein